MMDHHLCTHVLCQSDGVRDQAWLTARPAVYVAEGAVDGEDGKLMAFHDRAQIGGLAGVPAAIDHEFHTIEASARGQLEAALHAIGIEGAGGKEKFHDAAIYHEVANLANLLRKTERRGLYFLYNSQSDLRNFDVLCGAFYNSKVCSLSAPSLPPCGVSLLRRVTGSLVGVKIIVCANITPWCLSASSFSF
jgi:hypothetical protein